MLFYLSKNRGYLELMSNSVVRGDDELKSKLEELLENNELIYGGMISFDNGIMINDNGDLVDFAVLEYADRFDVYLNLYDEGEAPYRNILVKGSSRSMEAAQKIAKRKLNEKYEDHVH